ncbi:30628_t:CDS:2 [Gigaspora margarita]|uniref:30628_t:CDS:1 n=1 Tax=Gigaspora margarita TaxID=4874 RepID=A0ABN7UAI9_GIGMA|nr:30628_t:CDS:2 [Gigaspora margarita]
MVTSSIAALVFSTCCANRKVQLLAINQIPEPLLSLFTEEDSRSYFEKIFANISTHINGY